MRVIAVDPNISGLADIVAHLRQTHPQWDVTGFRDPLMAVKDALSDPIDALYTVVRMNRLDGIGLAELLKAEYPNMLLNFVCVGEEYRRDAKRMGAEYIVRPTPR